MKTDAAPTLWDRLGDLLFPPRCVFCDEILTRDTRFIGPCLPPDDQTSDRKATPLDAAFSAPAFGPGVCTHCYPTLPFRRGAFVLEATERPQDSAPSCDASGTAVSLCCAAPFVYEDAVREAIHRFKFENRPRAAQSFSGFMAAAALSGLSESNAASLNDPTNAPNAPLVVTWVPVSRKRLRTRGYDQAELLARAVAARLDLPLVHALRKVQDVPSQTTMADHTARQSNVQGAFTADGNMVSGEAVLLIDDICTTGATLRVCAEALHKAGAARVESLTLAATCGHGV